MPYMPVTMVVRNVLIDPVAQFFKHHWEEICNRGRLDRVLKHGTRNTQMVIVKRRNELAICSYVLPLNYSPTAMENLRDKHQSSCHAQVDGEIGRNHRETQNRFHKNWKSANKYGGSLNL